MLPYRTDPTLLLIASAATRRGELIQAEFTGKDLESLDAKTVQYSNRQRVPVSQFRAVACDNTG